MSLSREDAKLAKVREQLEGFLVEGKYYEAQQLYLSLYYRYSGRGKCAQAATLLHEGALKLIQQEQLRGAGELANALVDCYGKDTVGIHNRDIGVLVVISKAFQASTVADAETVNTVFLKKALKWSRGPTAGGQPQGAPAIHLQLARSYTRQKDYGRAQKHFLRAEEPEELIGMLLEWMEKGYSSERDLFLVRCVLELLCLENLRSANMVFKRTRESCAMMEESTLLNFTEFLLLTVERDAAPLFTMLTEKYSIALARDEVFASYLTKIGEVFFDIAKPAPAGLLGGLFGELGLAR